MKINLPNENDVLPLPSPNNALIDALSTRRSTKALDINPEIGPNDNELLEILSIATRVPDHGKIAPWRFIIAKDEMRRNLGVKMANIYKSKNPNMDANHFEQEASRFERAHTILFLISSPQINHPKVPEFEQLMSSGALGYSLNLSFHGFGYAATWLSEWPMYDDDIANLMGLATNEKIIGIFYIGKPKTAPTERARPNIHKLISYWNE